MHKLDDSIVSALLNTKQNTAYKQGCQFDGFYVYVIQYGYLR